MKVSVDATPLNRLMIKLSRLRSRLRKFNRDDYGDIVTRYRLSMQNVASIRQQL